MEHPQTDIHDLSRIDPLKSNRFFGFPASCEIAVSEFHVPCAIEKGFFILFFLHEEQPEVPEEKAASFPNEPLQEAWQGSAATWSIFVVVCRCQRVLIDAGIAWQYHGT